MVFARLRHIATTLVLVVIAASFGLAHHHRTGRPDVSAEPLPESHPWYHIGELNTAAKRQVRYVVRRISTGDLVMDGSEVVLIFAERVRALAETYERQAPQGALVHISSRFGKRFHPVLKRWKLHNGVDFAAPRGTPVRNVADGMVTHAGWLGAAGRTVVIDHDGYESVYAHMSRIAPELEKGVYLEEGRQIGRVGASGRTTGHHLHFAIRVDGEYVDPIYDGFDRITPLKDAEVLVDFERGVWRTLADIHLGVGELLSPTGSIFPMYLDAVEDSFL